MTSEPIRVLIVDDSAFSRQTVRRILEPTGRFVVAGVAANGREAIPRLIRLKPDIVLLDIEMPEMDGFAFLRWMLQNHPVPVVVISSRTDDQSVFMSMDLGAVDFVPKPTAKASVELAGIAEDLTEKLTTLARIGMDKVRMQVAMASKRYRGSGERPVSGHVDCVAIGASTGGPTALNMILSALPAGFTTPVVVTQHMPVGFTKAFAERLDRVCDVRVKEAADGDLLHPGLVLVAPGDRNLEVVRWGSETRVQLTGSDGSYRYVPSVDAMMLSAATVFGSKTVGVLLTGMGNDGRAGMLEIGRSGGYTIAESEETAVVFGMPQEAIAAGAVRKILPLDQIAEEVLRACRGLREHWDQPARGVPISRS